MHVKVGSGNQNLKFLFDTGSCNMWVNSRICEGCDKNQTESPRYDERKSDNYSYYDFVNDLHYGSGSVYGYVW